MKIVSYKNIKFHYHLYFQPGIKPFIQNPWFPEKSKNYWVSELENPLPKDFEENRRIGENESLICKIIRNDSISEFISYIKENHCSLNLIVSASIYETNMYLIKTEERPCNSILSLLSYSAYFGSIDMNAPIYYELKSKGDNGCCRNESYTKPPLYHALEIDNIEVIKLLLSNKAIDVNIPYSYNMYRKSVSYKQWECTPSSLESQMEADEVDIDDYDMTPLYYAIKNKKIDYVKLILANNKVDVNKPFKNYRTAEKRKLGKCFDVTPLVCAVKSNDATIVGLLLENKNINIDSKDQDGKKPIDYAKSDKILKLLKH